MTRQNTNTQKKNEERHLTQETRRKVIRRIASTRDGRAFLRWIMEESGYQDSDTVRQMSLSSDGKTVTYGDILPNIVIHNAATRGLWLNIRKHIKYDVLREIEIPNEEKQEDAKR